MRRDAPTTRRRPGGVRPDTDLDRPIDEVIDTPPAAAAKRKPVEAQAPAPKLAVSDLEALASMDRDELAALMEGNSRSSRVEVGRRVRGVVTRVGAENVFVDIGAKSEGQLQRDELPDAKVGDEVAAFVVDIDELGIRLSQRLSGAAAGTFIDQAREGKIPVEGRVVSRNPGGYDVRIGAVRAFCPVSQIDRHPGEDLDAWAGQTLEFLVTEAGEGVVVSRRALQEAGLDDKRRAFWENAKEGDVRTGRVSNVTTFGVFVDLDGVEGLVPKRELSWDENEDVSGRFKRGTTLEVRIVELDRERRKVTLSAKRPEDSPWAKAGSQFTPGMVVEGTVTRETTFGFFVELAPGLQGLVHLSKVNRKAKPSPGQKWPVRVLGVDAARERVELEPADRVADAPVGTTVTGTVQQVLKNGLVVDLDDGRTGWLPAKEIDLPAGTVLAQRFRAGKTVTARIVDEDPARRRVNLTLREPEDQAWRDEGTGRGSRSTSFGTLADLLSGYKPKK